MTSVIADPVGLRPCVRVVRRLPRGLHVGQRLRGVDRRRRRITWKNVSGNLPNAPVNFLAYDRPNDTLYAATDLGVFFMQDDIKDWTKLGDNLPNTATEDLKIQASSGQLYVGTFGRGTWRIPLIPGHAAVRPAGRRRPRRAVRHDHGHEPRRRADEASAPLVGEIREKVLKRRQPVQEARRAAEARSRRSCRRSSRRRNGTSSTPTSTRSRRRRPASRRLSGPSFSAKEGPEARLRSS